MSELEPELAEPAAEPTPAEPNPAEPTPGAQPTPAQAEPEKAQPPPKPSPEEVRQERQALAIRLGSGIFMGFVCVAIFNAVAFTVGTPLPAAGVGLRAVAVLLSFVEMVGVGVMVAGAIYAWLRFVPAPEWVGMLLAGSMAALALVPIAEVEIYRQACCTFDAEWAEQILYYAYQFGNGLAFPFALVVGGYFAGHRWLWIVPLILAAALAIGNQLVIRDDYDSVHGVVSFVLTLLVGSAVAPVAERLMRRFVALGRGRVAWGVAGVIAVGLLIPPPNAVRAEIFRDPACVAPWLLAASIWRRPSPREGTTLAPDAWLEKREGLPDVPPSSPRLGPRAPIVVMVTIDATRADAILDPANDAAFPTIARLKADGTVFTHASAPGSQTALCLSTLFSGKMFSELEWDYHGIGTSRFHYPAKDPTVRFPELLDQNGVETAIMASVNFIDNDYGIVRGFRTERMIARGRNHAFAHQVIDPAIEVLKHHVEGELFLYLHLMEPHAPYDRGKRTGTEYERYLSEIAVADRQLARLVRVIDSRFEGRSVIILGADHGEAFGEHDTIGHSKTLYDEFVRVPLIIRAPGRKHRVVEDRVLLADVGPTVLDIFGVPTPATFIGQSLLPFVQGRKVTLTRPLLAEGRLRRSITTPDGLKVIDDPRRTVVEAYDLVKDPAELHNVWGSDPRADAALLALRTFYANNEYRASGYSPPYKP